MYASDDSPTPSVRWSTPPVPGAGTRTSQKGAIRSSGSPAFGTVRFPVVGKPMKFVKWRNPFFWRRSCVFACPKKVNVKGRGTGTLAVFRRDEQSEVIELRAAGDGALTVLEVDDVDGEAERLADAVVGGPVSKAAWGGRVAYVRDPDGNLFELFQTIPMAEE